ncbi:hypothetical protein, partial [Escherichia coli]
SSGAGRTSDGNGSHASTLKSPSYTKSVSWQHYRLSSKIAVVDLVEKGEEETACDSDCSPLPEQRIREREPQF